MNRRQFLKILTSILGISALGAFLYPLFRFLTPTAAIERGKKVTLAKSEVPVGSVKDLMIMGVPSIVIHTSNKGFIALSRVCTHFGCLVNYNEERQLLICPCHAGVYDLEGNVISGPPPKPLERFAVKAEGENILIG